MALHLRDIIDLEFFFDLDEQRRETGDEDLNARDREIFTQINAPTLTDTELVREWLVYRRLLFFHETSQEEVLPGTLFASLTGGAARLLFIGGLILGLAVAYSFLAYHGDRPVNVTVFIAVFILLQALVSCLSFGLMAWRAPGRAGGRPPLIHALMSGLFFKKLGQVYDRACCRPGGQTLKQIHSTGRLMRRIHRRHENLMTRPFFILSSLFALGVSCGALGGTLFRVAVTDLAFGWQSTLMTSGSQVHELVRWMALPWSWALPDALPGLAQIQGSRIILKEGIAHLSSAHLTAWWPFLAMGLLTYGVLPRLALTGLAVRAQSSALARIDTDQPRFRRLLVRMRSPNMDTRARERQITRAETRPAPPRPEALDAGRLPGEPAAEDRSGQLKSLAVHDGAGALILIPEPVSSDRAIQIFSGLVTDQLGVEIRDAAAVSLDLAVDRSPLSRLAAGQEGAPVIFIQEVWQPPIRGLLDYYTRAKDEIFLDSPVWILLTQTPGDGDPGVPADDMNYKVWKEAVSRLGHSLIYLERIQP